MEDAVERNPPSRYEIPAIAMEEDADSGPEMFRLVANVEDAVERRPVVVSNPSSVTLSTWVLVSFRRDSIWVVSVEVAAIVKDARSVTVVVPIDTLSAGSVGYMFNPASVHWLDTSKS